MRRVSPKTREQARQRELDLSLLDEITAIISMLILVMGALYLIDAVRHRWTLLIIVTMGIVMNVVLMCRNILAEKRGFLLLHIMYVLSLLMIMAALLIK